MRVKDKIAYFAAFNFKAPNHLDVLSFQRRSNDFPQSSKEAFDPMTISGTVAISNFPSVR